MTFLISIIIVLLLVYALVRYLNFYPKDIEPAQYSSPESAPSVDITKPIKVLTWNVQAMVGGVNNWLFYDGGNDPWPTKETYLKNIKLIAECINQENPDIILLQEVDINSRRAHHINQIEELLKYLNKDYVSWTYTPMLKSKCFPLRKLFGPIDVGQCIITKFKITKATRYALESREYTYYIKPQFLFKRAVLAIEIPTNCDKKLIAMDTHFSAFAKSRATVDLQANETHKLLAEIEQAGNFGLLCGDFNSLASPNLMVDLSYPRQGHFHRNHTPLQSMFLDFKSIPSMEECCGTNKRKWYTYINPYKHRYIEDSSIDFIFLTKQLGIGEHTVLHNTQLSDHNPIIATLNFKTN